MLSIVGFLMVIVIVAMVLRGKTLPFIAFGIVPIIAALVCGFGPVEIGSFAAAGFGQVSGVAMMFIFSITYFGVMQDAGLFDYLVGKIVKLCGDNLVYVTVATWLVTIIGHLDGAGASTYLIAVPAMLPLYKKLNMRTTTLFLIIASTVGVANVVPWGGTLTRAAITIKMEPTELWQMYIPIQIFGLVLTLISAIVLGRLETRREAGLRTDNTELDQAARVSPETEALRRPGLVPVNLVMTLIMVGILVWGKIPTQVVFMLFLAFALVLNYRSVEEKKARIVAHAANVLPIIIMLLACGVFLGVISKTGMIEAMTLTIVNIIPESMGHFIPLLAGIFGTPVAMAFGPDPFYYGILPVMAEITKIHGLPVTAIAISMSIAQNIVCAISPAVPPAYLLYGLSGVELKDGIKSSFLWLWIMGIIMVIFGVLVGIIAM